MHWVVVVGAFFLGGFIGIVIMALLNMARSEEDEEDKCSAIFIDKGNR